MAKILPNEVQKHLRGVSYPAKKDMLVQKARENSAPDEVVQAVAQLPQDEFASPAEVVQALGETKPA